jgi:HK97 family phage portal protein
MRIFGWELRLSRKSDVALDEIIRRLDDAYRTLSGIAVTPETCEEAPTVQAIVNAISMKIATLPVHVLRKTSSGNREAKERLPSHPVARLLQQPNEWQTAPNYWLDATSWMVRYGRHFAIKGRGATGPIRRLYPVHPRDMHVDLDRDGQQLRFRVTSEVGVREYDPSEVHHVRARASNGVNADSPVTKAREAIALEIAAQRFGAAFFGNGAMPSFIFKPAAGFKSLTKDQATDLLNDFQSKYGSGGDRFKAMVMPAGVELGDPIAVENDKAQFLETRKLQRTVIAAAFGVPPHLVGDLEKGTFNNIEHQSLEFQQAVVLPYARIFEAAMERDLLTDEDRRSGVVIRFNLDGALRGDFKSRQEGLKIQREAGVISPNDWREVEGMNPLADEEGGNDYWRQGPSGQQASPQPAEVPE